MKLLLLLSLLAVARRGETFRAYDCNSPDTTHREIDLVEPANCPDPINDYKPPVRRYAQVLQVDTARRVIAIRCRLSITKEVTRCGYNSITYGSEYTAWHKTLEISETACRKANETGFIMLPRGVRHAIGSTGRSHHQYFSHGGVTRSGSCITATFTSEGRAFYKSYEEINILIHVEEITGSVDLITREVYFPILAMRADYDRGIAQDGTHGTVTWTTKRALCHETTSEAYAGYMDIHFRTKQDPEQPTWTGALFVVGERGSQQFMGGVLGDSTVLCNRVCYATQERGISVCPMRDGEKLVRKLMFIPGQKRFEAINLATQIAFLHMKTNLKMHRAFQDIQTDLCTIQRQTLHNKLQAIAGAENPYSLLDVFGPGHTILVAGAAAYVTQCVEVEVRRADFPNCTQEMPVYLGDERLFVDPLSWTLKQFPTILPCNDIAPVKWHLRGTWYCASPHMEECAAPDQLNTTITASKPDSYTTGLGKGLFSSLQQQQHRRVVILQNSRRAASVKVATATVDNSPDGSNALGVALDGHDKIAFRYELGVFFFPLFPIFGNLWDWMVTGTLLFMFGRTALTILVRAVSLYRQKGCGWWMGFALCEGMFMMITMPAAIIKATIDNILAPLEKKDNDDDGDGKTPKTMEEGEVKKKKPLAQRFGIPRLRDAPENIRCLYPHLGHMDDGYRGRNSSQVKILSNKDREMQELPSGGRGHDQTRTGSQPLTPETNAIIANAPDAVHMEDEHRPHQANAESLEPVGGTRPKTVSARLHLSGLIPKLLHGSVAGLGPLDPAIVADPKPNGANSVVKQPVADNGSAGSVV